MLDKEEFENIRYEGGIAFPRWINGQESLNVFKEMAKSQNLNYIYRFINEDFVIYNSRGESNCQSVELIGTLTSNLGNGEGNILAVRFTHSDLSGGDRFQACLIGNKSEDRTGRGLALIRGCLLAAENYADDHYEGSVVAHIREKEIRAKSVIFGRDEIERNETRVISGDGKLVSLLLFPR